MSPEEWAEDFRQAIARMEQDGVDLWIENGCCGCSSNMSIMIGNGTRDEEVLYVS